MKFYKCNQCDNIVVFIQDNDPKANCFGEEMVELVPKTADSAVEKHVPVVEVEGDQVKVIVGSTLHPMAEEHSIQWVALETEQGSQIKYLKPGQEPVAVFELVPGDKVVAAYEYCNLHGLWKA